MDEDPEGYAITTSHLPDVSPTVDCEPCSTPWIWIILFILFFLLALAFGIWLIWKYHHDDKNCSGCTGPGFPISVAGAVINVDSDTQISASWTTTDPDDVVTLFATLHPPIYNSSGGLDNPTAQTKFRVAGSAIGATGSTGSTGFTGTTGTSNSVILPGLTKGLKYYATLIARNGKTHNYRSYTQVVYMQGSNVPLNVPGATGANVPNTFEIQDILQVGAIQLTSDVADANGVYNVEFNQRPRQARDLFVFNTKSQLQLETSSTGLTNLCLFNSGGNVVAADCTNGVTGAAPGSVPNSSYFVYNPQVQGNANKLCLKNTVDNAPLTCLKLTGIGSGTGTLSFASGTNLNAGDAWALAFENTS